MILLAVPLLDRGHVHRGAGLVDDAGAVVELDVGAVAPDATCVEDSVKLKTLDP